MHRSLTLCAAALAACLAVAASAAVLPPGGAGRGDSGATGSGAPGSGATGSGAGGSGAGGLSEANRAAQARMDAFQDRQQATAERVIRSICVGCLPAVDLARAAGTGPGPASREASAREAPARRIGEAARRQIAEAARRPAPDAVRRPAVARALRRTLLARLMLPDDGE